MLKDLQNKFIADLISGESTSLDYIHEKKGMSKAQLLQIYQNNYKGLLLNLLKENFPVTVQFVGEKFFKILGYSFVKEHPMSIAGMSFYHSKFPSFLKNYSGLEKFPFLESLANFEYELYHSYIQDFEEGLPADAFQAIETDRIHSLRFKFISGISMIKSDYNIFELWRSAKESLDVSSVDIDKKSFLILCKEKKDVSIQSLDEIEYRFIEQLLMGKELGVAVEYMVENFTNFDFIQSFSALINKKWIKSIQ